jgi:Family of unknown function (DUF6058)
MSRLVPHHPHPALEEDDLQYVCSEYLPLEELARREGLSLRRLHAWIVEGRLPRPAYLLPDGTPMFPPDLLALVQSAGGIDRLADHFAQRIELAARLIGFGPSTREADWQDYLSGEYGICLRQVTPETLVLKEMLVARIGEALEDPRPDDSGWRHALAFDIRGLDALVRPFARVDRARFGRSTSRERLIEEPRQRWSWLHEDVRTGAAGRRPGAGPRLERAAEVDLSDQLC